MAITNKVIAERECAHCQCGVTPPETVCAWCKLVPPDERRVK